MKMLFKSESAAIKYYRSRRWDYSGGNKSNSRNSYGEINLMKPSRVPDYDSVDGGYQSHFLTIQESVSGWFAKFDRANNW